MKIQQSDILPLFSYFHLLTDIPCKFKTQIINFYLHITKGKQINLPEDIFY